MKRAWYYRTVLRTCYWCDGMGRRGIGEENRGCVFCSATGIMVLYKNILGEVVARDDSIGVNAYEAIE